MPEAKNQYIEIKVGEIAILVTDLEDKLQYQVYDNTTEDTDSILPQIVHGICQVASTQPEVIMDAYEDWAKENHADADQPAWAKNIGGNA